MLATSNKNSMPGSAMTRKMILRSIDGILGREVVSYCVYLRVHGPPSKSISIANLNKSRFNATIQIHSIPCLGMP